MAIIPAEEKVFMVSNSTNTTYSGSAALKAMQQWYTMQDVADSVQPYKVFTALLTQSGGVDVQYINWDDNPNTLTIGVTYTITANDDNSNFIPNGAPNNNVGTSFIATSSVVAWGTGNTGDNQVSYNIGAPVATVLENTIGNIWFTYDSVGKYSVNSNGLFIENKYVQPPISVSGFDPFLGDGGSVSLPSFTAGARCIYWRSGIGVVSIFTTNAGAYEDSMLYNTPIEIRIYN